ncbi:MAG: phosphotransferase family protein [Actinomycetota bacterium]
MSAPGTIQEPEARALDVALSPSEMGPRLVEALGTALVFTEDHARPTRAPACQILDVKYSPGARCTILYQVGRHMVLGTLGWRSGSQPHSGDSVTVPELGMEVRVFPDDPALPGLAAALDERHMMALLNDGLAEYRARDERVVHVRAEPIRYRPDRRCTVRLDLWVRGPGGAVERRRMFGKVYHDLDKATSVFDEMATMARLEAVRTGGFSVVAPAGFLPDIPMVLQEPARGISLERFLPGPEGRFAKLDPRGRDGLTRAAGALAALHGSGFVSDRIRPVSSELKKMGRRAESVGLASPLVADGMERLLDELSARLESLSGWGARDTVVHGDCKASQFLMDGDTVTLLDFDHCGMADPATDVGTFLATFRQGRIARELKGDGSATQDGWLEELQMLFLDGYCAAADQGSDFRARSAWYDAQALLRKAQRAFARSTRSPMPEALIEEGLAVLGALPDRRRR